MNRSFLPLYLIWLESILHLHKMQIEMLKLH